MNVTVTTAIISAIVSLIVASVANLVGIFTHRRAVNAQTYINVTNTARDHKFSEGMDIIRTFLQPGGLATYQEFKHLEPEKQSLVRNAIEFLNDLQHLIDYGYLNQGHVVQLYRASILDCKQHLLPWWVEGFRAEASSDPNRAKWYYASFEALCDSVWKRAYNEP